MKQLVLIRHGESAWNLENRFTGWADVDLTPKGAEQALAAGANLKKAGYEFDIAYTSVLRRAIRTLWNVQDTMDLMWIPVVHSWRLNERHYGALTGLNKAETAAKYGDEQVHIWRRSYDVRPPLLDADDERNPPELGVMQKALARIPNARLFLIPASDQTAGHGTTGQAKWWKKEVGALVLSAPYLQ